MRQAYLLLLLFAGTLSCTHQPFSLPATTPPVIDVCAGATPKFTTDIQPIFKASCAKSGCHDGYNMPLDFSVYAQIKPLLDDSAIFYSVIKDRSMPQDGALSNDEYNVIRCWFANNCPE